jgi:outer membrane protein
MKRILKIGALLITMFSIVGYTNAQKFGYVNSAEILAQMPEVKQADANLEALQKQLQKKGQGMLEKLQQDYAAVQQKVERGELSPKQQEEEAQKLKEREMEISKFEQDMRTQIQNKRSELLDPIYDKVNGAIQSVAQENGYSMIFDQSVLLYKEDSQNVSDLVKAKLGIVN